MRYAFGFTLALFLGWPLLATAHDYQAGPLQIAHPASVATPPGAPNGVAYLRISHGGDNADSWLAARTPVADRVELHRSVEKDGMRSMKHIGFPFVIEPGSELVLQPGGYHLMLMGLAEPLTEGQRVPLTLMFEHAGEVEVELAVEGLNESAEPHGAHAGH